MDLGIQQMRADGEREKARKLHVRLDGPDPEGVYLLLPKSHFLQPRKWSHLIQWRRGHIAAICPGAKENGIEEN